MICKNKVAEYKKSKIIRTKFTIQNSNLCTKIKSHNKCNI
jgi:hypothetical protein